MSGPGAQSIVSVERLTKHFPPIEKGMAGWRTIWERIRGVKHTVKALEDVSFEVRRGEIFGLLGPNGAGKTTLCKILNALVIPTAGRITLWGLDTVKHHQQLAAQTVTIFGGESDLFGLFAPRLSSARNLQFVGDLWGLPRAQTIQRVAEALQVLDLEDKRDEWYQKLSGGTKQKLFLAIPLILRRPLVVLDEPTIRLDVPTKRKVHEMIRSVLQGKLGCTILLTTHDMNEADRLCDRIAILNQGRLALVDTPQGLRRRSLRGPLVRLRLKLDGAAGRDEAALRAALARLDPALTVEPDEESDRRLQDGLRGFRVQLPRLDGGRGALLAQLVSGLAEAGLAPEHLELQEPTLEDVFVEVLGQDAARTQGPAEAGTAEAPA